MEAYRHRGVHGDEERSIVIHGLVFFDVNAIFLCWAYQIQPAHHTPPGFLINNMVKFCCVRQSTAAEDRNQMLMQWELFVLNFMKLQHFLTLLSISFISTHSSQGYLIIDYLSLRKGDERQPKYKAMSEASMSQKQSQLLFCCAQCFNKSSKDVLLNIFRVAIHQITCIITSNKCTETLQLPPGTFSSFQLLTACCFIHSTDEVHSRARVSVCQQPAAWLMVRHQHDCQRDCFKVHMIFSVKLPFTWLIQLKYWILVELSDLATQFVHSCQQRLRSIQSVLPTPQ